MWLTEEVRNLHACVQPLALCFLISSLQFLPSHWEFKKCFWFYSVVGVAENVLSNSLSQESRVPEGLSGAGGVLGYCPWGKMASFIHSINTSWELTEWMQEGRNGGPEIIGVLLANPFQGKCVLIETPVPSLSKTWHFLFHVNTLTHEHFPVCASLPLQVFTLWLQFHHGGRCGSGPGQLGSEVVEVGGTREIVRAALILFLASVSWRTTSHGLGF